MLSKAAKCSSYQEVCHLYQKTIILKPKTRQEMHCGSGILKIHQAKKSNVLISAKNTQNQIDTNYT